MINRVEPCFLLLNLSRMPAHVSLSLLLGSVGYLRGTHSYQTGMSRLRLMQLRIEWEMQFLSPFSLLPLPRRENMLDHCCIRDFQWHETVDLLALDSLRYACLMKLIRTIYSPWKLDCLSQNEFISGLLDLKSAKCPVNQFAKQWLDSYIPGVYDRENWTLNWWGVYMTC